MQRARPSGVSDGLATIWRKAHHATAPLLKDVSVQYKYREFNGSFMNEDVYRQEGSPEVDEAWEALGVDCKDPVLFDPRSKT